MIWISYGSGDKYVNNHTIYIPLDYVSFTRKEKMEEKIGKKREKRLYEKPAFSSEELFETAVLACVQIPKHCSPAVT